LQNVAKTDYIVSKIDQIYYKINLI